MATFTITRRYHRDGDGYPKGTMVLEKKDFPTMLAADAWATKTNARHEELPYHVWGVHLDNLHYIKFGMKKIVEAHQLHNVRWRRPRKAA